MKTRLRSLLSAGPVAALRGWWHRCFPWRWLRGEYPGWASARAASVGYDDHAVFLRARQAARAVRAGDARWERDGVLFQEPAEHAPLLAALRDAARAGGERLAVVDFGGAFGSTWWQHRAGLAGLREVEWRVVEQPDFVQAGRGEFTDTVLSFHLTLEEACAGRMPPVVLLSSVLQYLEAPEALLDELVRRGFRDIIIDRTPLARDDRRRLVVQHTHPQLGGGSYPCWIFDRREIAARLARDYERVAEWPGFDDVDPRVEFRGFHYRRKAHAGGT